MIISQKYNICQKSIDKMKKKLYNPNYNKDREVMNWKSEDCSAVLHSHYGSGTGYPVWEDFEQTNRDRSFTGVNQ